MKNLYLETQGVKGGNTKNHKNIGYIWAQFENNVISIDNFEGRGDSFKQRKEPNIYISERGVNNKTIFEGTFNELKHDLTYYKKAFNIFSEYIESFSKEQLESLNQDFKNQGLEVN